MPQRPCLTCGELIPSGSYCRAHAPSRLSPARGSGPQRAAFRRDTLRKTAGRCALCGSSEGVEAHHLIALEDGGSNDPEVNGLALCRDHHRQLERKRERAASSKSRLPVVRSGHDP